MKRKSLAWTASLCMVTALLAGCGHPGRPSPKDPVTLTMWHNYGGDMQKTMDALIDEFNSTLGREQGIVINVTAISSSAELNESLDMIAAGKLHPALIIGVPVGFVNVVESKERIIEAAAAPYIVARGRKGGSNVAAAICNAMLYQIRR